MEGFGYTRLAGAKTARINVIAQAAGRIYVATGQVWSERLTEDGWQMIPSTLTYGESNLSRVFRMSIYFKDVKAEQHHHHSAIGLRRHHGVRSGTGVRVRTADGRKFVV